MKRKLSYPCRQLKPVPRPSSSWRSFCTYWDILAVKDDWPNKHKKSAFVQRVNSVVFLLIKVHKFISVMNTVLFDVTPCNLVADTNISTKPLVTTLSVEERSRLILNFTPDYTASRQSRWLCGIRRGSETARLLGMRVRIPPAAWVSVSYECCVLSRRVLCNGPNPRLEESYWVWSVWV